MEQRLLSAITAAELGTRLLPVTKSELKEFHVLNLPSIPCLNKGEMLA